MTIRHTREATAEAARAVEHYRGVSEALAHRFIHAFDEAIEHIVALPDARPLVAFGARRCKIERFPYVIVYRKEGDDIIVYAVAHQSRRPGYWRDRLP